MTIQSENISIQVWINLEKSEIFLLCFVMRILIHWSGNKHNKQQQKINKHGNEKRKIVSFELEMVGHNANKISDCDIFCFVDLRRALVFQWPQNQLRKNNRNKIIKSLERFSHVFFFYESWELSLKSISSYSLCSCIEIFSPTKISSSCIFSWL